MDSHIGLLAGISLIVLIASSATSFPQSESLSELLLRRQTGQREECISYNQLQERLRRNVMDITAEHAEQLFTLDEMITQADLRSAAFGMCRAISPLLVRYRTTLESCPNADEVLANMHVFSGLCYADGTTTGFLNELIAGFNSSYFAWGSECSHQVSSILHSCRANGSDPATNMASGPRAFKSKMIKQEQCNAEGFNENDVSACGHKESLKRLACFCDLMVAFGPGVTFQLSDFFSAN